MSVPPSEQERRRQSGFGGKGARAAFVGVVEMGFERVEEKAFFAGAFREVAVGAEITVGGVADNREAAFRALHAELVAAASLGFELNERERPAVRERMIAPCAQNRHARLGGDVSRGRARAGARAGADLSGALLDVEAVAPGLLFFRGQAEHERDVGFADVSLLKKRANLPRQFFVARGEDDAGCRRVEAVEKPEAAECGMRIADCGMRNPGRARCGACVRHVRLRASLGIAFWNLRFKFIKFAIGFVAGVEERAGLVAGIVGMGEYARGFGEGDEAVVVARANRHAASKRKRLPAGVVGLRLRKHDG